MIQRVENNEAAPLAYRLLTQAVCMARRNNVDNGKYGADASDGPSIPHIRCVVP